MAKITGGATSELLYGTWNGGEVQGLGGNDTIHAGDGADNIQGGTGNDTFYGEAGNDWIDAGWAYHTFSVTSAGSGVTVNLDQNFARGGADAGSDTLYGFENVRGSRFG